MRRVLVPAVALALLPFVAVSPADAGTATPAVITPTSGAAALTFTLAEAVPSAVFEVRSSSGTLVYAGTPADLEPGDQAVTWDGRTTTGEAVADGTYVATLRAADVEAPVADSTSVRVNLVAPRASTAPRVSATSVFPYTDGYRDAVTITGQNATSDVTYARSLELLNSAGVVVWSSTAASARWTGRTKAGSIVAPGTFRIRSRFVDRDGLVGYSPARAITVSPKRLVRRTEIDVVSPRKFMDAKWVGKCGKIIKPARKGKAWKQSVGVSSNHRCTTKKWHGVTRAVFSASAPYAYDFSYLKVEAIGRGHSRKKRDAGYGYGYRNDAEQWSRTRRLSPKYGRRVVFSASGAAANRFIHPGKLFAWGVETVDGGRYDIKAFRIVGTYRMLVDPTKRNARVAPAARFLPRG